jgi:hypothetical protein
VFGLYLPDPRTDAHWGVSFRAFQTNKNRGGFWSVQSRAGVFALFVDDPRTDVFTYVGFRAFQIKCLRGCRFDLQARAGVFALATSDARDVLWDSFGFRARFTNKKKVLPPRWLLVWPVAVWRVASARFFS